jgi:arylsulfatase A-like enzyme
MIVRNLLLFIPLILGLISCSNRQNAKQQDALKNSRPNILFIAVDDLRTELPAYGMEYIKSPNLDKLTEEGIVFKNHYVAVPTCGASRHSLLTGKLPDTRSDIGNAASAKAFAGKPEMEVPETFIHQLRRNGYQTVGIGKISHHPDGYVYGYTDSVSDVLELPNSWDEMLLNADKWGTGHNAFFGYADGSNRNTLNGQVKPYEFADVEDEGYPDGLIARTAIEQLQKLAAEKQPFFLGVGFFKPHLPFNAPKKYWDLYNRDSIPVSPNPYLPENVHRASLQTMGEFHNYKLSDEYPTLDDPVSIEYARKLGHGYAACISYVDAQIGKLLSEIERLGLKDNTAILVWGDHGWHLGDHRIWGKHTLLDRALHSAFMMKLPGQKTGLAIDDIVSTIDIYPTLMELAELQMPYQTRGRSLVPLVKNPDKDWEEAAYSYFRAGYSVRVPHYRLTKYFRDEEPVIELFNHNEDPYETKNVADLHPEVVQELLPVLEKGYTGVFNE